VDILKTISQMQKWSKTKKKESKTICFVPTMGYLHQGHISLMEKGKSLCDELVISIFVNPAQFGPNEDLDTYPSNIENDLLLAKKAGVTAVFLPNKDIIYPENFQTEIKLQELPQFLCGKFRPVFFSGVTTVVTKLFNIVMPDIAVFGQKDYQQLQIIRQLVMDTFIGTFAETNIEYINFCDPETLEDINVIESETLLALVVKVGETRLIDNTLL